MFSLFCKTICTQTFDWCLCDLVLSICITCVVLLICATRVCCSHWKVHKYNFPSPDVPLLSASSRVYQFSKRHALEECRQQVALSQGMRAKLEAQRLLLKEKLDQLGSKEPPSALRLDPDTVSLSSNTSNVCSLCQSRSFLCLFLYLLIWLLVLSVSHS